MAVGRQASDRTAPQHSRLQRVLVAFQNRDWAGIVIELGVVTLGVLLAFQIDQWAQDRRQARQERQFLERMWGDTAQATREDDWVIGIHARIRKSYKEAFNARRDPRAMAALMARPQFGCGSDSMIGLGFNDTSYQELSASGGLNILTDPVLRSDLRAVAAAQADAVAQLNYGREISNALRPALALYHDLDLDRDGNRTCRVNWPALLRDPIARGAIVRSSRDHLLMWWKRAYARDMLAKAHNRIACKLGKPDCVGHVPQIVGRRNYSDILPPEFEKTFDRTVIDVSALK